MIVLVYGYDGSGDGHWQRWLEAELAERGVPFAFPELPDPLAPQKDRWVEGIAAAAAAGGDRPLTLVGHSLGCWAIDHFLTERRPRNAHAALLVAPPSPFLLMEEVQSFLPPPLDPTAWTAICERSLMVAADDDLYAGPEEHDEAAGKIGIAVHRVEGGGHINTDSGFGPWPFVLEWLEKVGALSAA